MRPKKKREFMPKILGFYTKSAETRNLFWRLDTNLSERWRRNWRHFTPIIACANGYCFFLAITTPVATPAAAHRAAKTITITIEASSFSPASLLPCGLPV